MKAIVTGGAGFIGSNIVQTLLEHGAAVTVVDNLTSGHMQNIEAWVKGGDIAFENADIRDAAAMERLCKGAHAVFHLAASVGRQRSLDEPILDSEINLAGTVSVLEAVRKNGVPKIIYSSSAAIFGELLTPVIGEDHPQNADSPYGVSKLAAEKMVLAFSALYGFSGICLRYFNVYGENQRFDLYGNVIPIFAQRLFHGQPLSIYGDGEQTRDFLHVRDIAAANWLAATRAEGANAFNIGSGDSITINHLAQRMCAVSGCAVPVQHLPERLADVRHCKADITHARKALGFAPSVDIEQGLASYLAWYRENCV